jgi:hypothetical protein
MAFADGLLLLVSALLLVLLLFAWLKRSSNLLPDIKNKAVLITGKQEHFLIVLTKSVRLANCYYLQSVSVVNSYKDEF